MLPRDNIVQKSKGTMMGLIGAYQDLEGSPPKQPVRPPASTLNPQRNVGSTANIPTLSNPKPKVAQPMMSRGQPQSGAFGSKPVAIGGAPQPSPSKGFLAKPNAPAQSLTKIAPSTVKSAAASTMVRDAVQRLYSASDVNLQTLLGGGYQKFTFVDRPNLRLFDFSEPECRYAQKEVDNLVENEEQNFKLSYPILPIHKIYPNSKLAAQINPANLRQGRVGDCYILGSMAVVAQHSPNIQRLLQDETPERASVMLCDSGVWKNIRLYKTVPITDSGYPIFASPTSGEGNSWQMVLEKAFAIIYGGYDMLELGHSSTALRELTGCGTEYIDLDGAEAVWTKVSRFLAKGWAITGSSKTADSLPQGASISPKHCYAVLAAKQVTVPGKNTVARFIRLKNPLGSIDIAKKFAADIQNQLGELNDGGGFWVTLGTLMSEFEVLSCCRIERDLLYSWHHVRNSGQKNNHCMFKLACAKGSTVRLALNHHNLRHYKGAVNLRTLKAMKYGVSRMIAFTRQGDSVRVLGYAFHSLQHISLEVEAKDFEEFYVWVNLDLVQTCLDKFTISASVLNSKIPVAIFRDRGAEAALPKMKLLETLAQCWVSQPEATQESDSRIYKPMALKQYATNSRGTLTGLVRYYGQCLGYVMFVYKNEHSSVTLTETLTPKKLTNVELIYPQQKFPVKLSLPPGSSQVVVLQFGADNNCSHESLIDSYSEFSG